MALFTQPQGFSNQGATPGLGVGNFTTSPITSMPFGSTPAGKALNNAATSPSVLPPAPKPTGAIKKTVVTAPSGHTVETHYDNTPGLLNTPPKSSAPTGDVSGLAPWLRPGSPSYTGNNVAATNDPNVGNQVPSTAPTTPPAGTTGLAKTASGAIVDLATGNIVSPAPSTFPGLISNLSSQADASKGIGQDAKDIAAEYAKKIGDVSQEYANAKAGYLTTGTTPVAEGTAAVAEQTGAAKAEALAKAEEAALQGTSQELTGQGQATTALSSAAGLAKPEVAGFGQTVFQPTTGDFAGGGAGGIAPGSAMDSALNQYAQMAASGQVSAVPSSITSNPVLNAELNKRAKSINPAYNPITSAAEGNVLSQLPSMTAANTAAKGIKNTIISFLNSNPDLNQADAALVNQAQQWLQGQQLTDPRYQTLFNSLNEYTSTLAPILGVGGDPTNLKTQIAQSFINAQASGQSIATVLNNIENLADQKITNFRSGALGGGVVSSPSLSGSAPNNNPLGI